MLAEVAREVAIRDETVRLVVVIAPQRDRAAVHSAVGSEPAVCDEIIAAVDENGAAAPGAGTRWARSIFLEGAVPDVHVPVFDDHAAAVEIGEAARDGESVKDRDLGEIEAGNHVLRVLGVVEKDRKVVRGEQNDIIAVEVA